MPVAPRGQPFALSQAEGREVDKKMRHSVAVTLWPGTCPRCGGKGLEGYRSQPFDYLLCPSCGWKSERLPRREPLRLSFDGAHETAHTGDGRGA